MAGPDKEDPANRDESKSDYLERIIEAIGEIGEGVFIVGLDFKVEFMNGVMIDWFEDQVGNTCYTSVAGRESKCDYCRLHEVIVEKKTVRYEPVTPEGRTYEVVATPLHNPDGSVSKLEIIRDITDRKEAEQQLLQSIEELTGTNTELERFAYVASHDLQEPLRTVTRFSQLLEKRLDELKPEEVRENLGFVSSGAKRMGDLVRDLLTHSHIGKKASPFEPVALADIIEDVRINLRESLAESEAVIEIDSLPTITADPVQVTMLFQNLLGNAVKYRRADTPPHVRIASERTDGTWTISVTDNGIGIDEKFHQSVFEPFKRLHTQAAYPGTGLGLAICRRIVERHGGEISLTSEEGKGTTFRFFFPSRG